MPWPCHQLTSTNFSRFTIRWIHNLIQVVDVTFRELLRKIPSQEILGREFRAHGVKSAKKPVVVTLESERGVCLMVLFSKPSANFVTIQLHARRSRMLMGHGGIVLESDPKDLYARFGVNVKQTIRKYVPWKKYDFPNEQSFSLAKVITRIYISECFHCRRLCDCKPQNVDVRFVI